MDWHWVENKKSVVITDNQGHIIARLKSEEGSHELDIKNAQTIVGMSNKLKEIQADLDIQRWHSIDEKPDEEITIEVYTTAGNVFIGWLVEGKFIPEIAQKITHWRYFDPPCQVDFYEAIRKDPYMTDEQKASWLRLSSEAGNE